ncbi:VWA domain-containing protein [Planctomycetales bacterium 10988]|nr:VWA domain-containing protein [Planctomycetales bacterium 10988]
MSKSPSQVKQPAAKAGIAQARPAQPNKAQAAAGNPKNAPSVPAKKGGMFRGLSAFSGSALVHGLVLVVLALWTLSTGLEQQTNVLTVLPEREADEVNVELSESLEIATELNSATFSAASAAAMAGEAMEIQEPMMEEVTESMDGPKVTMGDLNFGSFSGDMSNTYLGAGVPGEAVAATENYSAAMDRITQELMMLLSQGPTLVIWVFDESESMKDDQEEIANRVEKVYQELGILQSKGTNNAKDDPLLTSVCSYGAAYRMLTSAPTAELADIRSAMKRIPVDRSGKEVMCQAVGRAITEHKKYAQQGNRQLALILVSDESGELEDNRQHVEDAIDVAKQARCRIYALGREAVFGYPYAHIRIVEPETKIRFWRRINRGPESAGVEQLQTNGFWRRYDAHPSGFGPYDQVRMCRESGGVFFLLPSKESNLVRGNLVDSEDFKYAIDSMRPYLPDLGPRAEYEEKRRKSVLRSGIYQVIEDLNPYDKEKEKYIVMKRQYSLDRNEFAQEAAQQQVKAIQYIKYLEKAQQEIEKLKSYRDKEPNPRWQANYDLILAQLIAYRVRLYEFGVYLEEFKKNPSPITNKPQGTNNKKMKTTNWELRLNGKILTGDKHAEERERATQLFKQVIAEHPGTPWAARAQQEIKQGYGVKLIEWFEDPRRKDLLKSLPNL